MASRATAPSSSQRTVISASGGWFDWKLPQLLRYSDLIGLFVWRDFVSVYKQTILGPTWHLLRPLLATFVFTVVFGRMAALSTDGLPPFLFYLAGYVLWTYFASCLDNVSRTFQTNANLMSKVYFHRLVIPVSLVISNLVALGIQFILLIAVLVWYAMHGVAVRPSMWLLALPLVVATTAGYAFAVGIIACAVTTRYRDLTYLLSFALQFFMYLTPVIYPMSSLSPGYQKLVLLNPLTPLMEAFRLALLGAGTVTVTQLLASGAGMVCLLLIGLMVFSKAQRTFADTI